LSDKSGFFQANTYTRRPTLFCLFKEITVKSLIPLPFLHRVSGNVSRGRHGPPIFILNGALLGGRQDKMEEKEPGIRSSLQCRLHTKHTEGSCLM
jgi:hypothetical protein